MNHRFIVMTILAAFALLGVVSSKATAASAPTIGIVDVEKILAEAKAAQSLQKQIQAKREAFQKEFADKEKQLKSTEKSLIEQQGKLSAEDFGKKRKDYEQTIVETRKLFQKRRSSLDDGVSKAMTELRKNIVEATAKVADGKGYDIVLTRDSVLITEKGLDITAEVLGQLDSQVSDIKLKVE